MFLPFLRAEIFHIFNHPHDSLPRTYGKRTRIKPIRRAYGILNCGRFDKLTTRKKFVFSEKRDSKENKE
jgi:hypothetical protein